MTMARSSTEITTVSGTGGLPRQALWGGGAGWPGFTAVAKSEKGARFIAPDAGEIRRILARHSFLKPVTQAAGSFPGQDAAIPSVGSWSYVFARPGLPDEQAYLLARALHAADTPRVALPSGAPSCLLRPMVCSWSASVERSQISSIMRMRRVTR